MNTSRNVLIGFIIILIGLSVLFKTIGINIHLGIFIGPLIFFVLGLIFYRKNMRILSIIFFAIGLIALFDNVLHINIGGIIVALVFIYLGYRLLSGKKKEVEDWRFEEVESSPLTKEEPILENEKNSESEQPKDNTYHNEKYAYTTSTPNFKSSLIGDVRLLNNRFELEDMTIRNGIGDVKIDLSKAIISEGETVIVVHGVIGDVDIYVPYDLNVSVQGVVTIGDLNIFENRTSGINRSLSIVTKDYKTSSRRVKLVLSLFIGDIDVRYV